MVCMFDREFMASIGFFFIYRTVCQLYLLHWVLFLYTFCKFDYYGQFLN